MALCVDRGSGRSEEPAGHRSHHQLPQGALGAGGGQRPPVSHLLCSCRWRRWGHGELSDWLPVQHHRLVIFWCKQRELDLFLLHVHSLCVCVCEQEQVSGGTTNTVLRNLLSDTPYTVTVVPVYPEGEGLRQSDKGKTRKSSTLLTASDPTLIHIWHLINSHTAASHLHTTDTHALKTPSKQSRDSFIKNK